MAENDGKPVVTGKILEVCRGAQFRCEAYMGDKTFEVMAYTAGKMKKFAIKMVRGDVVQIELSPYDLTKGRIIFRESKPQQNKGV